MLSETGIIEVDDCVRFALLSYLPYINYRDVLHRDISACDKTAHDSRVGSGNAKYLLNYIGRRVVSVAKAEKLRRKYSVVPEFLGAASDERMRVYEQYIDKAFGNLRLKNLRIVNDKELSLQFSAITVELDDSHAFVAFGGTDLSVEGWKEDFLGICTYPTLAQKYAASYLSATSAKYSKITIGGHSKGGNLAVYAAMNCKAHVEKRIDRVYSFDGQGFMQKDLLNESFSGIKERIIRILPKDSIVGRLMYCDAPFMCVESAFGGVFQHDLLAWQVENGSFVKTSDTESSCALGGAINAVAEMLNEEDRKRLIEAAFGVLYKCGDSFDVIINKKQKVIQEFFRLNKKDRLIVLKVASNVLKCKAFGKFMLSTVFYYGSYMKKHTESDLKEQDADKRVGIGKNELNVERSV